MDATYSLTDQLIQRINDEGFVPTGQFRIHADGEWLASHEGIVYQAGQGFQRFGLELRKREPDHSEFVVITVPRIPDGYRLRTQNGSHMLEVCGAGPGILIKNKEFHEDCQGKGAFFPLEKTA